MTLYVIPPKIRVEMLGFFPWNFMGVSICHLLIHVHFISSQRLTSSFKETISHLMRSWLCPYAMWALVSL